MPNVTVACPHCRPSWNRIRKLPAKLRELTHEAIDAMNETTARSIARCSGTTADGFGLVAGPLREPRRRLRLHGRALAVHRRAAGSWSTTKRG